MVTDEQFEKTIATISALINSFIIETLWEEGISDDRIKSIMHSLNLKLKAAEIAYGLLDHKLSPSNPA